MVWSDLISPGNIITILGTFSFAVSGAFAAMQKRLDAFGVLIVAFVTSVGGGTVRDLVLGDTPVFWLKDGWFSLLILLSYVLTLIFWKNLKAMKTTLFLFDSLGLGFFTIIGLEKGLVFDLHPGLCIALGTITGCFGGISRDILLNNIPLIFRKEIYATACILGGSFYFILPWIGADMLTTRFLAVAIVVLTRIVAVKFQLTLPRLY